MKMPIIDFKEIPEAHITNGKQDSFELFCQEFVKYQGLDIISVPDRGVDGGKDLICLEKRKGGFGITEIKWLVSCKHKAHSGSSVTPSDEENICDRIIQHKADGFIGFYSTVVSSGLNTRLNSYKDKIEVKIFNSEDIEEQLLSTPKGKALFQRFFKNSYEKWNKNSVMPALLYNKYEPLLCSHCGKDILNPANIKEYGSLIGFVRDYKFSKEVNYHKEKFIDVYYACKGRCDDILDAKYSAQGYITDWKDVDDLKIPVEYMRWIMACMNNMREGSIEFEDDAFEKIKKAIMSIGQYVMRDLTDEEVQREDLLNILPEWLR
ncbi:hypothetical protein [Clostridium argentinense]|nr:hypothetical protein [Clostridium argentinense]NFP49669.1 restriction endonuclease [Clostridium argentinense]NFP72070.1 restriction endonuclease [Clostridium argentinense]NFP76771.1 restriction endonuclease [Clostridium argentinense]